MAAMQKLDPIGFVLTDYESGNRRTITRRQFLTAINVALSEAGIRAGSLGRDPIPARYRDAIRDVARTISQVAVASWVIRTDEGEDCGCPIASTGLVVAKDDNVTLLDIPVALNYFAQAFDSFMGREYGILPNPTVVLITD